MLLSKSCLVMNSSPFRRVVARLTQCAGQWYVLLYTTLSPYLLTWYNLAHDQVMQFRMSGDGELRLYVGHRIFHFLVPRDMIATWELAMTDAMAEAKVKTEQDMHKAEKTHRYRKLGWIEGSPQRVKNIF